jgi:glycosyltransferase involved in cell wall biosynthesis
MFNSPFNVKRQSLNNTTQIVFVADMFSEQYSGGAELTSDALIEACPLSIEKVLCKDVTLDLLEQGQNKYWIFGNFSSLDFNLIPTIVANMKYSVVEYDYKYCKYRSPEKHYFAEQTECDCEKTQHGKLISAFYYGSQSLWWMSEKQQDFYFERFPFLQEKYNTVLSSVFSDFFFQKVAELRNKQHKRSGWIVLGSNSWVKGADLAEQWCIENKKDYKVLWGLSYEDLLTELSLAEGFVYLPKGKDTCPRMVIEAKVLGCELVLNDNVQHKDEEWFSDASTIEEYLYGSRTLFWDKIVNDMNHKPTISGYTTSYNCITQKYPYEHCIKSMLDFCDEVIVVDGGSSDGTWEKLCELSLTDNRLKIMQFVRDWSDKRSAIFDGAQKAEARKLCTMDYCWQMDADEICPPGTKNKIHEFLKNWPATVDLVSFPVVEFWGSEEKVRVDVNPWKWRMSKNLPYITHGIPSELRKFDSDGKLYASQGTDGCDYIDSASLNRIPHACFYNEQAHNARMHALNGNKSALEAYENWLQECVNVLPSVKHYSWMDIERKIKTYRDFWGRHWQSLYDIKQEDTAENNMFFDKPWKEVTDADISKLSKDLADKCGGHIFHTKVNLNNPTPWIKIIS